MQINVPKPVEPALFISRLSALRNAPLFSSKPSEVKINPVHKSGQCLGYGLWIKGKRINEEDLVT